MQLSKIFDKKKFMWDGVEYNNENDSTIIMEKYKSEGYETRSITEEDKYYVFTRKVVTEIKIEGIPPN